MSENQDNNKSPIATNPSPHPLASFWSKGRILSVLLVALLVGVAIVFASPLIQFQNTTTVRNTQSSILAYRPSNMTTITSCPAFNSPEYNSTVNSTPFKWYVTNSTASSTSSDNNYLCIEQTATSSSAGVITNTLPLACGTFTNSYPPVPGGGVSSVITLTLTVNTPISGSCATSLSTFTFTVT
jgi:hypothetical protein